MANFFTSLPFGAWSFTFSRPIFSYIFLLFYLPFFLLAVLEHKEQYYEFIATVNVVWLFSFLYFRKITWNVQSLFCQCVCCAYVRWSCSSKPIKLNQSLTIQHQQRKKWCFSPEFIVLPFRLPKIRKTLRFIYLLFRCNSFFWVDFM